MGLHDGEREQEPWMGWAQVSRIHSAPGAILFDSEIRHPEYVRVRIGRATRTRDLNRDWIMDAPGPDIVEIDMSVAQWGAFVSSFGSSGVPCTVAYEHGKRMPEPQPADQARLTQSSRECRDAGKQAIDKIEAALANLRTAVEGGRKTEIKSALRSVESHVGNLPGSLEFAAVSLTEHVENVVTKAKGDIENIVERHVEHLGLTPGDARSIIESVGIMAALPAGELADEDGTPDGDAWDNGVD